MDNERKPTRFSAEAAPASIPFLTVERGHYVPSFTICIFIFGETNDMMKHRPEYDLKIIGENLKRLRVAKSLSVDEVREYLRLGSVQAVYKYEQGKGYPQTDTMLALMELYDAELRDIVCKHEPEVQCFKEAREVSVPKVFSFYLGNLELYIEMETRDKQIERMKKYYECIEKGIAS